jgi:hypothetical protein
VATAQSRSSAGERRSQAEELRGRRPKDGDWATQYLSGVEELGSSSAHDTLYLWESTPLVTDLQAVIEKRVGASDLAVDDPRSRTSLIVGQLRGLIADSASGVTDRFRLLDIACGDAVVLWQIQKAFPLAACHGLDCNIDVFATAAKAIDQGVFLYKGYLQHLFGQSAGEGRKFDVVLMLNTYRSWNFGKLRKFNWTLPEDGQARSGHKNRPEGTRSPKPKGAGAKPPRDKAKDLEYAHDLLHAWFAQNARFVFLTAKPEQIARLRRHGWFVQELGKGEEKSVMICASREPVINSSRSL